MPHDLCTPQAGEPLLERLIPLLREAGQRLLSRQPSRARHDASLMRQCVDDAGTSTLRQLGQALRAQWPDVPVFPAGLKPDRLPAVTGLYWLCDPLDGAIQYLAGLPMWTCNLTLMQGAEPLLALVHDACLDRSYHALRGQGAGCDGEAIRCSEAPPLALSTLGTSFPNVPARPQAEVDDSWVTWPARCRPCWPSAGSVRPRCHWPWWPAAGSMPTGNAAGTWSTGCPAC